MYSARDRDSASTTKHRDVHVERRPTLKYSHRLNFYDKPPLGDITIEEFETCALDRLRILAEIESSFVRNRPYEELKEVTLAQCKKYLPLNSTSAKTIDRDAERRKDHVGHFVLRLAFCRSEELRRRFVKAETALFRMRYDSDDNEEREEFLSSRDFDWIPVSDEEKKQYQHELAAASPALKDAALSERYYKVKWTRVPDLVEKRRVLLKGGMAYVPSREQSSIVFQEFQTRLTKALEMTAKALPRLDEDTRIVPILDNLSQGFLAGVSSEWSTATSSSAGEITADMIDDLARKHFPLCMRNLHETLRREHHLKHFGRLQYGLFLKVLGLSIDEAITFWRRSFSNMQDDKFNKEYRYNIRHSYGLEGKRANYPAKSCQQILTADQPGAADSHGCPYRHFSPDNLQTALLSMYSAQGLTAADLPEIMSTVKAGHYHVACTRVFEITHASVGVKKGEGIGGGESVTHPNQYAAKSRELEKEKAGVKLEDDGDVQMTD
ncbi:DNA primase large subunit [Laetiporus sulphureus 93-53]|uniref:DNA primase large subunit n=1 Tax=Laetiporus sulphureus 93-53 TaxID=1314785 RepID=A0A165H454_9APHY|nr:DNA primase large subunit [Laetiporus sulphureus 93-53]KZT11217.1 DNA primase large subunit [Laetiporus sulphureus 93-53]